MTIKAANPEEYLSAIPEERVPYMTKLRETISANIPEGFEECMQYNMISFAVPHSLYLDGYHCKPTDRLPFVSIASQKNFIALYHMGIYANPEIMEWFVEEYPKHCKRKLDMGKSCIRFKKMEEIPYDLIAELMQKISVKDWIKIYEATIKK